MTQPLPSTTPKNDVWIQTYSGIEFHALSPKASEISLLDIAHALSNKCRFAGHTLNFYSVAQHSVLVSSLLPVEFKMWGLLHDAGEAYFADIPQPIKREFDVFEQIEEPIMRAVAEKFQLYWPCPKEVKVADKIALATEARDLLPVVWRDWETQWESLSLKDREINPLDPTTSKMWFLEEFYRISSGDYINLREGTI